MTASAAGIETYLSMTTAGVWFAMIAKGAGSTGTSSQSRDGEASRFGGGGSQQWPVDSWTRV